MFNAYAKRTILYKCSALCKCGAPYTKCVFSLRKLSAKCTKKTKNKRHGFQRVAYPSDTALFLPLKASKSFLNAFQVVFPTFFCGMRRVSLCNLDRLRFFYYRDTENCFGFQDPQPCPLSRPLNQSGIAVSALHPPESQRGPISARRPPALPAHSPSQCFETPPSCRLGF